MIFYGRGGVNDLDYYWECNFLVCFSVFFVFLRKGVEGRIEEEEMGFLFLGFCFRGVEIYIFLEKVIFF